jgi:aerobic carbon-monoxide dehydrogenase medium subunit
MYPVPIDQYHRPGSVEEARTIAAEATGECFFVAGGMSLMQAIKSRMIAPDCLIDLNSIDELRGIDVVGDTIRIGAMTRYRNIAANEKKLKPFSALTDAASHVGDRQVRNRGTLGGSLCWNFVSACAPAATLACGANIEILRKDGSTESILIDDFLLGPMTTALDNGDLVTAIVLQDPHTVSGSAYCKWGIVKDSLPVIGVAVFLELTDSGACSSARFAVAGLAGGPQRSSAAENMLINGINVSENEALRKCALAAADELETIDDPWISADYKTQLIGQLGTAMLIKAAARART